MISVSYLQTCKYLIVSDLTVFKRNLVEKLINKTIWMVITLSVASYILPSFGLTANFGPLQFGGILAAIGLFEIFGEGAQLIADLQGDCIIGYNLTLPIPSYLALVSKITAYALSFFIMELLVIPVGKACLWTQLSLTAISYGKLLLILFLQSYFFACAVLLIATLVKDLHKIESIWSRYIFPLWFLGGFQFSWSTLYRVNPTFAYIDLSNPMIYITEGTRAALLGQEGYLNYWICIAVIFIFTLTFGWLALHRMQRQLDYVP